MLCLNFACQGHAVFVYCVRRDENVETGNTLSVHVNIVVGTYSSTQTVLTFPGRVTRAKAARPAHVTLRAAKPDNAPRAGGSMLRPVLRKGGLMHFRRGSMRVTVLLAWSLHQC